METKFTWTADESEVLRAIQNIIDRAERGEAATGNFGDSLKNSFDAKPLEELEKRLKTSISSMASYDDILNAIAKRTATLKDQNKDLRNVLRGVEKEYEKVGKKGSDEAKRIKSEMQKLEKVIKDNNKEIEKLGFDERKIRGFKGELADTSGTLKTTSEDVRGLSGELSGLFFEVVTGQTSIIDLAQQVPGITRAYGGVRNTFKVLGQVIGGAVRSVFTLRTAFIALAAIPIIGVITAIIAVLAQSEKITRAVGDAVAYLTGAFDRFSQIAVDVTNVFVDFVTGQKSFAQAVFDGSQAVTGLGNELNEAGNKAVRLKRELEQLAISSQQLDLITLQYQQTLTDLRIVSDDNTKSIGRRINAIQKAGRIEQDLLSRRIENARRELEVIRERNTDQNGAIKTNNELIEAQRRYQDLLSEQANAQAQIRDEVSQLREEQQREAEQRQRDLEAAAKASQELVDKIAEANAILGGQADVVALQYDFAIRKIKELQAEAEKLGLDLDFSSLFTIADAERQRGLDEAAGLLPGLDELPNFIDKKIKEAGSEIGALETTFVEPLQGVRDFTVELGNAIDEFKDRFNEAYREALERGRQLTDAQKQFIAEGLKSAFREVASLFVASTNAQIAQQDAVISRIRETTKVLEQQLREQQALKEKGYRNDVDALEKRLEDENAKLQKAQAERLELQRKAANQQLIADSAIQASQIGVAVARLIAEGAKGFVPGLLIAAAAVPLIFSIIARAKSNAEQVSQPPTFRDGTPYLEGNPHEYGGVKIEAEVGERIFSRKLNNEIDKVGGRQVTNEELVELYKVGAFVTKQAKRASMPIVNEMAGIQGMNKQTQQIVFKKEDADRRAMAKAYERAAMKSAKLITLTIKEKIDEIPKKYRDSDGNEVIERTKGGVHYKDKIEK